MDELELANGALITARCEQCGGVRRIVREFLQSSYEDDCDCVWQAEQLLEEAAFPERFRGKTLSDLDWDALAPSNLVAGVREYADALEAYRDAGIGMALFGEVGNGKTHIAIGIGKIACALGHSVAFVTLADALDDLRATYERGNSKQGGGHRDRSDDLLDRLFNADWLILDDLGIESDTSWAREKVYQIVNRRWLANKPIIVTTNKSPEELARRLGEGLISRLWGDGIVLHFRGEDYRLKAKQQRLATIKSLSGNGHTVPVG